MKKIRILCLLLAFLLLFGITGVSAAQVDADHLSVSNGCHTIDGVKPYFNDIEPIKNVQAAFLYEMTTDTVLYSYNADTPMHPTSLTKIMTALLVLENSKLNDLVTVEQSTLDTLPSDAAKAKLVSDEIMTVEELLYCMMVDSANDAAVVLAEHTFDSQETFVAKMNQRAQELGCENTNFSNVHGLMEDAHLSTAKDMAKILRDASKNPQFMEIFGTKYHTVPATNKSEKRELTTGNFLMTRDAVQVYYDSRVTGGRTGILADGSQNLAVTAENDGLQMISVVLGSASKIRDDGYTIDRFGSFPETSELLNLGFNGMAAAQVLYEGQAVKQYPVAGGAANVAVGPGQNVMTLLPQGIKSADLTFQYSDVTSGVSAPVKKGDKVTTLLVMYNGICLAQEELYALHDVDVAGDTVLQMPILTRNGAFVVILWILVILAVAFLALLCIRRINILRMAKRKKRKHRRNH